MNISTANKIRQQRRRTRRQSPLGQDPFFDLFEQFFSGPGAHGGPRPRQGGGLGTGFIISKEGLIITNNHVIANSDIINVQLSSGDKKYEAEVVGSDKKTDIALIKIKAPFSLPTAHLGTSSDLKVGEWVAAFGNPFGHTHSMSKGIVSAIGRKIDEINRLPFIQTDASINPGNSGGPLVNVNGEVIGVNTAIDARAQGIGFAIPIDSVKKIVAQLKKHGGVKRPFIGVELGDIRSARNARVHGLPNTKGALVTRVSPGTPAFSAGLKSYDFITKVNKRKVSSSSDLINTISDFTVGEKVSITLIRKSKVKKISLRLGDHPENTQLKKRDSKKRYKGQKAPYNLGFYLENYTTRLAREFRLPPLKRKRPVIIEVRPGTPAASAELMPGDIILDVNQAEVYKAKEVIKKLINKKINVIKILRDDYVFLTYISAD